MKETTVVLESIVKRTSTILLIVSSLPVVQRSLGELLNQPQYGHAASYSSEVSRMRNLLRTSVGEVVSSPVPKILSNKANGRKRPLPERAPTTNHVSSIPLSNQEKSGTSYYQHIATDPVHASPPKDSKLPLNCFSC